MFGRHKTDVVVVGAGPIGLLSALELGRHKVDVEVIDAEPRSSEDAYVYALEPKTIDLLVEAGVSRVLDVGQRIDRVAFFDDTAAMAELAFDKLSAHYPFVLLVPKSRLVALLEEQLAERKIRVRRKHRLAALRQDADAVHLDVDVLDGDSAGYAVLHSELAIAYTEHVTARLCIGADGDHSMVRRRLEIDCPVQGPAEQYVLFAADVTTPTRTIEIVLADHESGAMWPLADGRTQWSFHVGDRDGGSSVAVPEDMLLDLLHRRAPSFEYAVQAIDWAIEARFERRLVDRFGGGRIWLAGDAAHVTTPIAARGINLGLHEASDLAACCVAVLRDGAPLDHLNDYEASARRRWAPVTGLPGIVHATEGASPWVRDHAAQIVEHIPASGSDLRALAQQIGLAVDIA